MTNGEQCVSSTFPGKHSENEINEISFKYQKTGRKALIVQKQVMGAGVAETETTIILLQDTVPSQ